MGPKNHLAFTPFKSHKHLKGTMKLMLNVSTQSVETLAISLLDDINFCYTLLSFIRAWLHRKVLT